MNDLQIDLIAFGTHLLASQLGIPWPLHDFPPPVGTLAATAFNRSGLYEQNEQLQIARKIIQDNSLIYGMSPHAEARPNVPVFKLLNPPIGVEPTDWVAPHLSHLQLQLHKNLKLQQGIDRTVSSSDIWGQFWEAMQRVSDCRQWETFYFLLAYYGWNLAGTVADTLHPGFEHGISVFEQLKATSALSHCLKRNSDEDQAITLVAGDIPGIQRMLYTITAKGAAKTLRGRSAYLLLLSDSIIRLVLQHFDLPWANVIVSAGGNFLVAAPEEAESQLADLADVINGKLLDIHRGELYIAMAAVALPACLYADSSPKAEIGSLAERHNELQSRLEASKHAAFARLAKERFSDIFEPKGGGGAVIRAQKDGNLCEMCHTEIGDGTRAFVPEDLQAPEGPGILFCEHCHSFAYRSMPTSEFEYDSLAWIIANADRLFVSRATERPLLQKYIGGKGNPPWNIGLRAMGLDYQFIDRTGAIPTGPGTLLTLEPTQFLPETLEPGKSYGFRFLSRLTPREDSHAKEIRDFHQMASEDAIGIHRYGVLRMDVDDLGKVISGGALRYPDLLHLSALSNSLDCFFGGMLDQIGVKCLDMWQKRATQWRNKPTESYHKRPYIIYAGGDDLFIVAAWDLLPLLAKHIQQEFSRFCMNRLTLSGGIAIAREKYPLYRVAEQAGLALDQSKDHKVMGDDMLIRSQKNSLTFLGETLNWDEVAMAWELAKKLVSLLCGDAEGNRAPRALLQVLNYVAWLYRQETPRSKANSIKLGRWLWFLHYGLRRLQRRLPDPIKAKVADLPSQILMIEAMQAAGERLRQLEEKQAGNSNIKDGENEFRKAIREHVKKAREGWPVIRYLGLPDRWAEFLTRKED